MWCIEKLQSYINDKVEESLHLDYKAADALMKTDGKKKEIGKDVSAFANSDGGVIIYGIREYKDKMKFLPGAIDPIDRNYFSKETLEQIINSNISPKITGIIITPISIGDEVDNKVVYIVEIPKSDTAHQASDKRYYRRYNFQSEMMDDWEIKDIINRSTRSNVIAFLNLKIPRKTFDYFKGLESASIDFELWVFNKGNRAVDNVNVYLSGGKEDVKFFNNSKVFEFYDSFEMQFSNEKEYKINLKNEEYVVNTKRVTIMPGIARNIGSFKVSSAFFKQGKKIKIVISTDDNRVSNETDLEDMINDNM